MWKPLENNPEVLEAYLQEIGVENVAAFDIFSLNEIPEYLPRPIFSLLLVYPENTNTDASRGFENDTIVDCNTKNVHWYPQTIANACGTMALLHAVANGIPENKRLPKSFAASLVQETTGLTAEEKAKYIENSKELARIHAKFAGAPSEDSSDADVETDLHFLCFTKGNDDYIYVLDGRRKGPIRLFQTDGDVLNERVLSVMRDLVEAVNSPFFSVVALADS
ncbi:ubiquitin carboxy terminal hydrolase Uch1 [Schizosaccharomyces japonicus yFS275]|uniref:Ubiquitin carboxyl-terminal hydrolase n=1 Tax=Schizosaccharomyces japonicus (strain yFS275 / FY16936) TaxID=402676 RepID=B6JWL7_SCHJY|nr:ubiquitin carboxy terminal hydrolase Uch1 [Schizosaccharomyces japonicus yFS275]EEB05768.1 ubiquitin carboxy terminal hydrolase Uch1 [Schizosaccharomyces japonicus yFS275]